MREDTRRGEMPLARIMTEAKALGNDAVLVLRAPFEPAPLYKVLANRGFAHWTEHCGPDDWSDEKGALGILEVAGAEEPDTFRTLVPGAHGTGGH